MVRAASFVAWCCVLVQPASTKKRSAQGEHEELKHWQTFLNTNPNVQRVRLKRHREIEPEYCDAARAARGSSGTFGANVALRMLDVGAGPLTTMGDECNGKAVDVHAVDLLAPKYDKMLAAANVVPRVRTTYCRMEGLAECFPRNHFALVYCGNALDHAQDPVLAIRQMVEVVAPGGSVVLLHHVNESTRQNASGMHQWDLFANHRREFIVSRLATHRQHARATHTNVGAALGASVRVHCEEWARPRYTVHGYRDGAVQPRCENAGATGGAASDECELWLKVRITKRSGHSPKPRSGTPARRGTS